MTRRLIQTLIVTGALLLLSGCGGEKYRLSFAHAGFEAPKEMYAPGERVKVTYNLIGTDTDYRFHSDDVEFEQGYDPKRGYIFRFTMPDHDVTLSVTSYSSMEMDPDAHPGQDPENGEPVDLLADREALESYRKALEQFLEEIRETCFRRETPYALLDAGKNFEEEWIPLMAVSGMI